MSTRELAELACRIIAVALLAFTLLEIAMGLASLLIPIGYAWRSSREMEPVEVLFGTVIVGIPLALRLVPVWFLWTRAEWISRQMVPYAENRSRWPRLRATNLQIAGFACIGLYFFCTGVSQLGRFIGLMVVLSHEGQAIGDIFATDEFIGIVANFAVGIWLMVGSRGVVRFLLRLRRPNDVASTLVAEAANLLPTDKTPV